jgi:hypothetical protein
MGSRRTTKITRYLICSSNSRIIPSAPLHCLDDLATFLLYAAEAFGKVAHGQVDHPDRRETNVRAACMADSRRLSIIAQHSVVSVVLAPVL